MVRAFGHWIVRTLLLCWSMTWRATLASMIGAAVTLPIVAVTSQRPLATLVLIPSILAFSAAFFGVLQGVPTGLLLGLVTRLWFDRPIARRRYRWLMRVLGALIGPGAVVLDSALAAPQVTPLWVVPRHDWRALISVGLALLLFAVTGWLAGDWAAGFHLQSRADEQQAGPLPRRPTVPTDEQTGIQ